MKMYHTFLCCYPQNALAPPEHALNLYRGLYLVIYASTVTDSTIGITLFIPAINDHYGYLTFTLRLSLFFDSKTLRLSWRKSLFQFCVVPEHQYVI